MKVLFINEVFENGSTGNIVKEIGEVLEANGHEYKALYGRAPKVEDSHAVYIGHDLNAVFHAFLTRITDRCGFYSRRATKKAIEYIKDYNPDVIHLHNLHGYYINIEELFTYLKNEFKGKVIWTLHDCWAFTGHCPHYTYVKCYKWKFQCSHCPQKKCYPVSLVLDQSRSNYRRKKELFTGLENMTIVTPSYWLACQVQESFLKDYPCVVINNGIDLDVFKPSEQMSGKSFVLNVANGVGERKGFGDLIKISKQISDKYDVVFVGARKKDLKKVPKSIKAIRKTRSKEELAKYYSSAAYFVNTTYEDTFSMVNIEALACGTPVITYRSGGSPESIDNYSGYVVEPGDYEGIVSVLRDSKIPDSASCRARALKYDKWEKYKEYLSLYLDKENRT